VCSGRLSIVGSFWCVALSGSCIYFIPLSNVVTVGISLHVDVNHWTSRLCTVFRPVNTASVVHRKLSRASVLRRRVNTAVRHVNSSSFAGGVSPLAGRPASRQCLPRDTVRKRGLCCRPVSVCLSVTLVDCINTAEDIVKLLCRPSSPIILVF